MATGCPHPFGGRVPRHPFWKHRDTGEVIGPACVALSDTATASASDPGDATRAANKTAILAAKADAVAQGKALLVDGTFFWDGGGTGGLDLSGEGLKIIGRTKQCFDTDGRLDGFVGQRSTAPTNPHNAVRITETTGQELWNLYLRGVGAAERDSDQGHHGIFASGANRLRIVGCNVYNHCSSAIHADGGDDIYIARSSTNTSFGDGFLFFSLTDYQQSNLYVENCSAVNCGDDYFASTSYTTTATQNVTFRRCNGSNSTDAGGIAAVGVNNGLYQDIHVTDTGRAGFKCYTDGNGPFASSYDVLFDSCSIGQTGKNFDSAYGFYAGSSAAGRTVSYIEFRDCSIGKVRTDSPQYYIGGSVGASNITFTRCTVGSATGTRAYSDDGTIADILFDTCTLSTAAATSAVLLDNVAVDGITYSGCTITSTTANGNAVSITAAAQNVTLDGNTISAPSTGTSSAIIVTGGPGNLTITDNTIGGASQWGVRVTTVALTGNTVISGNTFSDISKSGASPESFIDAISLAVNQTTGTITISGNTHNNPNSNEYNWDWDLSAQTTALGTLICTNNVRGTNTGGAQANYATSAGNQDAGTGIRIADPDPGWTISGNT